MIDPATYKKLYEKDLAKKTLRDDLGAERMVAPEPPPVPFCYFLPSTVDRFNM